MQQLGRSFLFLIPETGNAPKTMDKRRPPKLENAELIDKFGYCAFYASMYDKVIKQRRNRIHQPPG